jgi:hypothetical protein
MIAYLDNIVYYDIISELIYCDLVAVYLQPDAISPHCCPIQAHHRARLLLCLRLHLFLLHFLLIQRKHLLPKKSYDLFQSAMQLHHLLVVAAALLGHASSHIL